MKNKDKRWFKNGKLHRDGGPAIEFKNGTKKWYKNGKLHRFKRPAIETETEKSILGKETKNQISINFPTYDHLGDLYFTMDEEGKSENDPLNWWNIYGV